MAKKPAHNEVTQVLIEKRDTVFARFPLVFTLLVAFGLAITLSGIQGLIGKVPFLSNNPVVSLAVGLSLLALTGRLYKKLG